jgi:endonuclease III
MPKKKKAEAKKRPTWPAHDVIELRYLDDPWRMLVVCQLLNLTHRAQVEQVVGKLFSCWPTEWQMSRADPAQVADVIKSLGLQNRRSKALVRFSNEFCGVWVSCDDLPSVEEIESLHGVGPYARDAYRIFFLGERDFEPSDRVLASYLRATSGGHRAPESHREPEGRRD